MGQLYRVQIESEEEVLAAQKAIGNVSRNNSVKCRCFHLSQLNRVPMSLGQPASGAPPCDNSSPRAPEKLVEMSHAGVAAVRNKCHMASDLAGVTAQSDETEAAAKSIPES